VQSAPILSPLEKLWFAVLFLVGSWCFGLSTYQMITEVQALQALQWPSDFASEIVRWSHPALYFTAVGFTVLTFVALFRHVRLSTEDYHSVYTLDDIPIYALIFIMGRPWAVFAAAFARIVFEGIRLAKALKNHPERVHRVHVLYHFSDVATMAIVTFATAATYLAFRPTVGFLSDLSSFGAVVVASAVWVPLAFGITAISLTARRHLPLIEASKVLRENFAHVRVHIFMLVPLGALVAYFYIHYPWLTALLMIPILTLHNALEAEHKVRNESEKTIQAVAHYLEERDVYTQGHSERVSQYACEIAREMGLNRDQVEQVRRAGLIHDIGKVDIPDSILNKPGMLSTDERAIMRTHTDRAVELGEKLQALQKELPFREAAYHHENYDGTGHYKMAGEDIPLTSRILAVADTFDAMTSDRPYRKGMPLDVAQKRIEAVRGTQLDPRAVDAFLAACRNGAIQSVKDRWAEKAAENA
jgi:putative nucleotidyltransferase with HDIG domain